MNSEGRDVLFGPPPVRETIGAVVHRRLREAILTARIPMGARINELELAAAWQISRTPIRDALQRLEAEGLVQAAPGRGSIVPMLTRTDVEELYVLREALEGMTARCAADRATPQFLGQLNTLIKGYGAALKQDDLTRITAADDALREAVVQMAQNRRLEQALHSARLRTQQIHVKSVRLKGRAGKTFRELAKLVAAMRTREGTRAEARMREHLASLRGDVTAGFDELMAMESL